MSAYSFCVFMCVCECVCIYVRVCVFMRVHIFYHLRPEWVGSKGRGGQACVDGQVSSGSLPSLCDLRSEQKTTRSYFFLLLSLFLQFMHGSFLFVKICFSHTELKWQKWLLPSALINQKPWDIIIDILFIL